MSEKLTSNQQVTLKNLSERTYPWEPRGRSTKLLLAALGRKGMAQYRYGHPIGWVLTDDGREWLQAKGEP